MKPKIPLAVIVGLILAIVLDTLLQISWKFAVSGFPRFYFYFVMAIFVAQYVNWMRVLARADLSFAQPFTALGYITVLTLSSYFLHEKISLLKIFGVILIILGVFFIS